MRSVHSWQIPCLLNWRIQRFPDDEHLAAAQFAHTRRDQVGPNFPGSLLGRPDHLLVLTGPKRSGVFAETHPPLRFLHAQLTVPLQPSCEGEPSPPGHLPEPFAGVPGIHEDMGMGSRDRPEGPDDLLGKVDLAQEPDSLCLCHDPLPVEKRWQRATAAQQKVEACEEAVATDLFAPSRRVVHPKTLHDLLLGLLVGESSVTRRPVTTVSLGRPTRLGRHARWCAWAASTRGII